MGGPNDGKEYSVIGYVRYIDSCPAPVILVFGRLDEKLLQNYSFKGVVQSFVPMPSKLEYRFQVWEGFDCRSMCGGIAQLGVEHPSGELIVGDYNELPTIIRKNLRTLNLENDCFAAFELATISNDVVIQNKSAKHCVAKMSQISPLAAKDWIEDNFTLQKDKKRLMKHLQDINRNKSAVEKNYEAAESQGIHGEITYKGSDIDKEMKNLISQALEYSYSGEANKAREIFKSLVSDSTETPILMEAYQFFVRTGMYDDADAVAVKMIEAFTPGTLESAIAHGNRVSALVHKNDLEGAQKHLDIAKKIYEKFGDTPNIGSLYGTVGMAYYQNKNYEMALELMTKAHEMNTAVDNRMNIANDQNHFAMIYQQMGGEDNIKKSLSYYESAIVLNDELIGRGYRMRNFNLGNNYGGIGLSYFYLNKLDVAREHWEKALKLFESVGAFDRVGIIKGYLSGKQENEQLRH